MARKRRRKPGDVAQLQAVLWQTIIEVEGVLDTRPPSHELILKAAHALAQLAGVYGRILEVVDLDARLTALEQHMGETNHHGTIAR